jgi:iron(III) transport system substrate-binding protein
MKTPFTATLLLLASGLLAACGGTTAAPSSASPASGTSAAKPASSGAWNDVIAAAKKEGKVSVIGPQGNEIRDALTQGFMKAYPGVEVDLQSLAGDQTGPKVITPMAAGQHPVDLAITGTTTAIEALQPAGVIVPVQDWLVGPNDSDPKQWLNNKFTFSDNAGKYSMVFSAYVKAPWVVNGDQVNPAEFKSSNELLNPKYKDKIGFRNPRAAGGGLSVMTYWWATPSLGKDFIKKLVAQNPIIENDDRQLLDSTARGKYLVAIGPSDVLTTEFMKRGLPIKYVPSTQLSEGAYTTAGNGSLVVFKEPAHPNATKLYLDYLLSKEGQTAWTEASGIASYRRDVPHDKVVDFLVPREGVTYQDNSSEELVKDRSDIVTYLDQVFPK